MPIKIKQAKRPIVGTLVFYTVYFIMIVAAVCGILYALKELQSFLDKYERSLEKYEAQTVFDRYFAPCRFDDLYDMQNIELSEFEDKEDFVTYMEKQYGGKEIIYKEVSAGLSNDKKYTVAADKVKFAEFTLTKNSAPVIPEDTWLLNTVSTNYQKNESVAVKIYKTSKLFVNDKEISDTYLTTDNITTESCERVPEGVTGILLREYKVDGLLLQPALKVINRHGKEGTLVFDEESKMYVEQISYDEIPENVRNRAIGAAQTYAKYITLDASLYNVSQYFDTRSNTYNNIRISENRWYTHHIGFEFKDVELKEYYIYDENTFSIRYSCNHYVYRTGTDKFLFPLDLTFYFKNINGTFYVYDMISNY